MLSAATQYRNCGWSVFPVRPDKKPYISWTPYQTSLPSQELITNWWTQWPNANIGVALGDVSSLVRIDVDGEEAAAMYKEWSEGTVTREFSTPSGGRGYLYQHFTGVRTEVITFPGKHCEFRVQAFKSYTLVPPSTNYQWLNDADIAELPLSYRVTVSLRDLERAISPLVGAPKKEEVLEALSHLGQWRCENYEPWLHVLMALHSGGPEYMDAAIEWSKKGANFKHGEVEKKFASFRTSGRMYTTRAILAWAKEDSGWKSPTLYEPMNDEGNASVFARLHSDKVKYVRRWKSWISWTGKKWRSYGFPEAQEAAKEVIRFRYNAIVTRANKLSLDDSGPRKKALLDFAKKCVSFGTGTHIANTIQFASSIQGILIEHEQLNQHPYLFNCANGTLDLRTMHLKDHDPSDMLTQVCPTAFNLEAECPRWEQFLLEVFQGNTTLVRWLQKFFGYCLTGDVSEEVMLILWGEGSNGKSKLLGALQDTLGTDYMGRAPKELFSDSKGDRHPTEKAKLFGLRVATAVETKENCKLPDDVIKEVTSTDMVSCRGMHENFWDFVPTHKLILATNHMPSTGGTDRGIWRRIKKIPFLQNFYKPDEEPVGLPADLEVAEKLAAEAEGILQWLLKGCAMWFKEGLGDVPEDIKAATKAYRREQNKLSEFVDAYYSKDDEGELLIADVKKQYLVWCSENRKHPLNDVMFGKAMEELGFSKKLPSKKYYLGLQLKITG